MTVWVTRVTVNVRVVRVRVIVDVDMMVLLGGVTVVVLMTVIFGVV